MKTITTHRKNLLLGLGLLLLFAFKSEREKPFNFHEFWGHYNDAYYEMSCKSYEKALLHFEWLESNAIKNCPGMHESLNLAICYAKLGDTTNATSCLRQAIRRGYINPDEDCGWARWQIGERSFREVQPELGTLQQEYYRSRAVYLPMLLAENERTAIDQFMRSTAVRAAFPDTQLTKLCYIADSININSYIADVKRGQAFSGSVVIYHLYGPNEQYAPFIDSCMKVSLFTGRLSPDSYSFWYDRQLAYVQGKPQKFGQFIEYDPARVENIQTLDSVDYYRKEIGLPPLWKSAQMRDFALPEGYKRR